MMWKGLKKLVGGDGGVEEWEVGSEGEVGDVLG